MTATKDPTSALLIIGNEVLSGRTVDKNIAFLTAELFSLGIPVGEVRIVQDTLERIGLALNDLRTQYTYVFTTGGIGPTHDDVTAEAVAKAFNLPFEENVEASSILLERYGDQYTPARRRMSMMPHGAKLLHNPASGAPGFCIENVYVLPGVPTIMQSIFRLLSKALSHGDPIYTQSITLSIGEGAIADELRTLQEENANVEMGSYPFFKGSGQNITVGTCIVLRSKNQALMEEIAKKVEKLGIK